MFVVLVLAVGTTRAPVWLEGTPSWSVGGADFLDVALGDVDHDGDLDLAAYATDRVRVYENMGGAIQSTVKWTSTAATTSYRGRVVWADLNQDSYPELITSDGIFANAAGVLSAAPTMSRLVGAGAFAVGDMNNDGYVDLLTGRSSLVELFQNSGGTIDEIAEWNTTEDNRPGALAVGDVDGDGFLELAVGNRGGSRPIRLYDNVAGTLTRTASWASAQQDLVNALAFGDVDGGGYPELASATDNLLGQVPNRMFRNLAGTLETNASWNTSRPTSGNDLGFADFDKDGDLDLALANVPMIRIPDLTYFNGRELVYLNENGVIDNASAWQSAYEDVTYGLDLGDVNGDGYTDLVSANGGDLLGTYPGRVLLYANQGPPNNPPVITRIDVAPSNPGANETVLLTVTATDPDGDPLEYTFSFVNGTRVSQSANQLTWRAPNEGGNFTIYIEVSDGRGGTASANQVIPVAPPPPPHEKPPEERPFFSLSNSSIWVLIVAILVAVGIAAGAMVRRKKRRAGAPGSPPEPPHAPVPGLDEKAPSTKRKR